MPLVENSVMAVTRGPSRQGVANPVQVLAVRLGEIVVGTLARLENDATVFAFDPEYAADANRPTLSLAFKGPDGNLVENLHVRTRLSPFFSNLLPEGHLRQYLATRG